MFARFLRSTAGVLAWGMVALTIAQAVAQVVPVGEWTASATARVAAHAVAALVCVWFVHRADQVSFPARRADRLHVVGYSVATFVVVGCVLWLLWWR